MTPSEQSAPQVTTAEPLVNYKTLPHGLGTGVIQWFWTKKRAKAAELLSSDALTDEQIAKKVGVSRQSLATWKRAPEFQARRGELMAALEERMKNSFVATRAGQVKLLAADFNATSKILEERGVDAAWMDEQGNLLPAGGPGGSTGFMVREFQGVGKQQKVVFKADAALFKVRQDLLKQIAILRGFWSEKSEVEHSGEIKLPTAKLADADIEREIRTIGATLGLLAQPETQTLVESEDGVFEEPKAAESEPAAVDNAAGD